LLGKLVAGGGRGSSWHGTKKKDGKGRTEKYGMKGGKKGSRDKELREVAAEVTNWLSLGAKDCGGRGKRGGPFG